MSHPRLLPGQMAPPDNERKAMQDPVALLEELRLHQAELEVQNQELRRAQAESAELQRYYQTLFDSLPLAALVIDGRGVIMKANVHAYALFGFRSASQLRQHAMYRLLTDDSAQLLASWLNTPPDAHSVRTGMMWVVTPKGDDLHMEAHLKRLPTEEIERLAFYDPLTGLPNRYLLKDRVRQAVQQAQRSQKPFGLAFIDLYQFKEVNDLHGHNAGDQLLCEVVARIRQHIRSGDTLARLGGDEFILMMTDMPLQDTSSRLMSVLRHIAEPYRIDDRPIHVSGSIGLAIYPDDGPDYNTLLKHADMAMYQAKADGRNTFRLFNQAMAAALQSKYVLESNLRKAIERDEFQVVYQPQVSLNTGQVVGLEALLRWHSHELGTVAPDEFIPSAEQTGQIHAIGAWVLDQVCRQMAEWQRAGYADFTVTVNVSARQFWADDFVERIRVLLDTHQIPGKRLEIELTERVAMQEAERAVQRMLVLKSLGVRLSIDDFGTGYSSLAYLRWMPVNLLKIDKSFVDDIGRNPDDEMICRSIINLARGLHMPVLAEGVETQAQADFLLDNGCDYMQGYLFARPMAPDAVLQLPQL